MILNPELRRNVWLELTIQRLIMTPFIIGLILYLCYLTNVYSIQDAASTIFFFYLFLWGTKSASESIPDEINDRTWDYQRLSIIKPWALSWGKLLGSTAYAWYGALLALIPYALISLQTTAPFVVLMKVFILLLGGLFAHSVALLASMSALQSKKRTKVKTFFYFLTGLFLSILLTSKALNSFILSEQYHATTQWYHFTLNQALFDIYSLSLFFIWSLIGIVRNMRSALQYPCIPWMWFLFTIFCMLYFAGFFNLVDLSAIQSPLKQETILIPLPQYIAFLIAVLLTYIALFSEKINLITYKKMVNHLPKLNKTPRWPTSFVLVILMGIWLSFSGSIQIESSITFIPIIFVGSVILLMLRDVLIIHYFQFTDNPKRTLTTALFYLAVLYILIPSLCSALAAPALLALFLPETGAHWMLSVIGLSLEVLFMIWMVTRQWRADNV